MRRIHKMKQVILRKKQNGIQTAKILVDESARRLTMFNIFNQNDKEENKEETEWASVKFSMLIRANHQR